jgi:S1-C subfamily serine protease
VSQSQTDQKGPSTPSTPLEDLLRTQAAFIRVAKQARPAVVNISAVHRPQPISNSVSRFLRGIFPGIFRQKPEASGRQQSTGSGFIISHHGYILTNRHVVAGADEIRVRLLDEREFLGEIIEADERSDLAVVKIPAQTDLPVIALGNSDQLEVGDWVVAIGNPFGLDQTVTVGVISATGRSDLGLAARESFIQTDAMINFGNSGGPLLNLNGEVIGINTAVVASGHGIGFAVPVNATQRMAGSLLTDMPLIPVWLGIMAHNMTPQEAQDAGRRVGEGGVWVESVIPGTPAESAGLKSGDLIIKMDSAPLTDVWQLKQQVAEKTTGAHAEVGLMRARKPERMTVVFSERPSRQEIQQMIASHGIDFP